MLRRAGFVFDAALVDDILVGSADFAAALCKVQPSLTRGWHTVLDPGWFTMARSPPSVADIQLYSHRWTWLLQ